MATSKNTKTKRKSTSTKSERLGGRSSRRHVLYLPGWYDEGIHRGIALFAREKNWSLLCPSRNATSIPDQWTGDGVVAMLADLSDPQGKLIQGLAGTIPIVNLTKSPKKLPMPEILQDDMEIGRLAAEHLLDRGFSRFVFFLVSRYSAGDNREAGFRESIEKRGGTVETIVSPAGHGFIWGVDGRDWLIKKLSEFKRPFAVMASNEIEAVQVIHACSSAGLKVPEDVAVIGVDNDPLCCELAPVPVTSVDNNRTLQGYKAAQLLGELMEGVPAPKDPIIIRPAGVVVRHSTEIFAVTHPAVSKALMFIQKHYSNIDITANDIVRASGLSRAPLHTAFMKHVGHSVADMLRRQRIEVARLMLRESDKVTEEIAELSGFSSAERMSKVFKRTQGKPPSEFRDHTRKDAALL